MLPITPPGNINGLYFSIIKADTQRWMIVKRKKGYYVLSEKTRRNLGGPYKSRQQALKRLRQIEFFKHQK